MLHKCPGMLHESPLIASPQSFGDERVAFIVTSSYMTVVGASEHVALHAAASFTRTVRATPPFLKNDYREFVNC